MTTAPTEIESLHETATQIFEYALDSCRIDSAFDRHLRFEDSMIRRPFATGGEASSINLKEHSRIFVIAIGKAAVPMLNLLLKRVERLLGVRGICCSPEIPSERNWRIRYFAGGHPLPSEGSFAAARAALALLEKARPNTLVLFLISGGGSALFELPLDPGITLEDTMAFHEALVGSGAPITEINIIRKHFSAVKGGRLAIAARQAAKLSIMLPDVPLRSLEVLASGPTCPDHSKIADARALIEKYKLRAKFPAAVNAFFDRAATVEAGDSKPEVKPDPKPHRNPLLARLPWVDTKDAPAKSATALIVSPENPAFRNSMFEVLLSSRDLVEGARVRAIEAGFHTEVDNSCDDWDYADAARYLLERFHRLRAGHPRCCLISGGEVTVTLDRTPGAGGRNQQFALACALEFAQHPGEPLVAFSAGSDGIDGNTRAAGAIADTTTVARAIAFGYQPAEALAAFNACPLFTALGDSVVTGPTGHNLRDLRLLISAS